MKRIFLMLLIVNSIQGQIISIDSLDNDGLYNEFYSALPKNQNRAFKIAKLFVKRQKENNDINNLLDGYSLLIESDYKNSLKYLDTIINLSKNLEDKLYYPAGGYFALASAHYKNKNYQAALNNFIKTFELANDNKYLKNNALNNIGILKLEKVNEEKEALEIFKECLDFYKNPLDKEYYIENFLVLNFSISEAYRSLNKIDSSQYYNKEGLKYHDKYAKDTDLNNYFIYSEGINNYKQGNYKEAALKLKEAYPTLINYDDMDNAVIANYYLGKSYEKLNLKYKSEFHLKLMDSIFKKNITFLKEVRNFYEEQKNIANKNNDPINELKYLNHILSLDSVYIHNYKSICKVYNQKYDHNRLVNEKEELQEKLSNKKTQVNYTLIISIFLIFIVAILIAIAYSYRKKNLIYTKIIENKLKPIKKVSTNKINIDIPKETILEINKELEKFESKKEYLQKNITINGLAKIFKTNSKYLREIIHSEKQKSFPNYINDLRIEYCIKLLKEDKAHEKYTIANIAEQVGFSNTVSFNSAFEKYTQLKPSFFISKLKKTKDS